MYIFLDSKELEADVLSSIFLIRRDIHIYYNKKEDFKDKISCGKQDRPRQGLSPSKETLNKSASQPNHELSANIVNSLKRIKR